MPAPRIPVSRVARTKAVVSDADDLSPRPAMRWMGTVLSPTCSRTMRTLSRLSL